MGKLLPGDCPLAALSCATAALAVAVICRNLTRGSEPWSEAPVGAS